MKDSEKPRYDSCNSCNSDLFAHILFLVNIDGVNINALTLEEASLFPGRYD